MKKSKFQFRDPELLNLSYKTNLDFDIDKFKQLTFKKNNQIHKDADKKSAYVSLCINIGDESSPFTSIIEMGSLFTWDDSFNDQDADYMLNNNAIALLLSYIRPIISTITNSSRYPAYNIPYVNFLDEDEKSKEDDKTNN